MKRGLIFLFTVLFCQVISSTAGAMIMEFDEIFLGSRDDANEFRMAEPSLLPQDGVGNRARFFFDLSAPGDRAQLLDTTTDPNTIIRTETSPTTDETDYDPDLYLNPFSGWVNFVISDWFIDRPVAEERVRINIERGTQVETFDILLETDMNGFRNARVNLNGDSLTALSDGTLLAVGIAPAFGSVKNTFSIERVRLHAEAHTAPVPEPGIMLLLVPTLIGLTACGRKSTKNSKV